MKLQKSTAVPKMPMKLAKPDGPVNNAATKKPLKFDLKKNALHYYLKIPTGKPVPTTVLQDLTRGNHPEHVQKMAQFALNAKQFEHK